MRKYNNKKKLETFDVDNKQIDKPLYKKFFGWFFNSLLGYTLTQGLLLTFGVIYWSNNKVISSIFFFFSLYLFIVVVYKRQIQAFITELLLRN